MLLITLFKGQCSTAIQPLHILHCHKCTIFAKNKFLIVWYIRLLFWPVVAYTRAVASASSPWRGWVSVRMLFAWEVADFRIFRASSAKHGHIMYIYGYLSHTQNRLWLILRRYQICLAQWDERLHPRDTVNSLVCSAHQHWWSDDHRTAKSTCTYPYGTEIAACIKIHTMNQLNDHLSFIANIYLKRLSTFHTLQPRCCVFCCILASIC